MRLPEITTVQIYKMLLSQAGHQNNRYNCAIVKQLIHHNHTMHTAYSYSELVIFTKVTGHRSEVFI